MAKEPYEVFTDGVSKVESRLSDAQKLAVKWSKLNGWACIEATRKSMSVCLAKYTNGRLHLFQGPGIPKFNSANISLVEKAARRDAFIQRIARLQMEGEGALVDGNDAEIDTLYGLIRRARELV